ncbi:hypothetical protein CPAR01_01991 [Colletotrichum paranaense]|uniref:Uncharacterized protein n=3 Tax=Colletotrichum acutatum species complex TaxID=2707335 RepID=A0AAJ0E3R7_9PEZI|nr:uncharacterized protein CCOS01_03284 [Colletotrichum costaricense]XP_060353607.1 uncharacterized protein CPAR01_01991 [Colletotrichum paranaense]KAK1459696.1 hypothetical protein CMEL01_02695 [Colletotrichum melonis]KAK1534532.1 hypothetical protein CCOS01_03284 [Colletotrichum costaricense]KAK1544489.1 hypothetical protein CPAR01_01991 [Colletotrichum paranaense]
MIAHHLPHLFQPLQRLLLPLSLSLSHSYQVRVQKDMSICDNNIRYDGTVPKLSILGRGVSNSISLSVLGASISSKRELELPFLSHPDPRPIFGSLGHPLPHHLM